MGNRHLERMKAIVAQAVAEAQTTHNNASLEEVTLIVYGGLDDTSACDLFGEASQGTPAEGAQVVVEYAGARYICWNCCGLRFASEDGYCPNCGDRSLEIPEEIMFALRGVKIAGAET